MSASKIPHGVDFQLSLIELVFDDIADADHSLQFAAIDNRNVAHMLEGHLAHDASDVIIHLAGMGLGHDLLDFLVEGRGPVRDHGVEDVALGNNANEVPGWPADQYCSDLLYP